MSKIDSCVKCCLTHYKQTKPNLAKETICSFPIFPFISLLPPDHWIRFPCLQSCHSPQIQIEGHTESASNCLYTPNYLNATPLLVTSEGLASHTSLTPASCHKELLHCWRALCMRVRVCEGIDNSASADLDNCKQTSNQLWLRGRRINDCCAALQALTHLSLILCLKLWGRTCTNSIRLYL